MAKNKLPVSPTPKPERSGEDEARERRYRAESALSTIEQAEKHKADKPLMREIKKIAKEKMNSLKKFC